MRLRSYLVSLVLVVMVPLLAFAVATTVWTAKTYRDVAEADLQNTTRALSLAVEKEVEAVRAVLGSLAASPALDNADLATFYRHAQAVGEASGTWVTLMDGSGQELLTTQLPFGSTPLRSTSTVDDIISRVFATGMPFVSDLVPSVVDNKPVFGVAVPVMRDGRVLYVLGMPLDPGRLSRLLAQQQGPGSALATLWDSNYRILACSRDSGRYLGRRLSEAKVPERGIAKVVNLEGEDALMAVERVAETPWTLGVAVPLAALEAAWRKPIMALAIGGVVLLNVAALLALVADRFLLRPVNALATSALRVLSGHGAGATPSSSVHEFALLSRALNSAAASVAKMNEALEQRVQERTRELAEANRRLASEVAQRQEAEDALLQKKKVEAVGLLAAGVAHDFNNLLTGVIGNIELLRSRIPSGRPQDLADHALKAADRGATLTRHLLAFARKQRLEPQAIDLNRLVEDAAPLLRQAAGPMTAFTLELGALGGTVVLDGAQIEVALLNLAVNARDAMPHGGRLTIRTEYLRVAEDSEHPHVGSGDWIVLTIADTGLGMTPEVLARAFDPFFTTKGTGRGSGLGLSMVHGLVTQLGAEIAITSEVGHGTTIWIYFPRMDVPAAEGAEAPPMATDAPLPARLLVVDDDPDVLHFTVAALKEAGHTVAAATSGAMALEMLAGRDPVDLVVLDYAMPQMNGAAVARQIRARRSGMPILFATGFAEVGRLDGEEILPKPFTVPALLDRVHRLLARRAVQRRVM